MKLVTVKVTRIQWHDADTTPEERMMLPATYDRFETYVNDPADEQELLGNILDGLFLEFEELVMNVEYRILSSELIL